MSSWAQGQSWVVTGKARQMFAGDLEARGFHMSSCDETPPASPGRAGPGPHSSCVLQEEPLLLAYLASALHTPGLETLS